MSGLNCRGKIVIDRAMLNVSTWKEKDCKKRVTFFHVVQFARKLGLTPAFVLDCKCTKWSIKPLKIEDKKFFYRNEERTLLRKSYEDFVVYYSWNAWINGAIYAWELQRVSLFLKRKTANTKYLIMVDNVPSHIPTEFLNLKTLFTPPNTTAKLQPLDCSIFATLKNQDYSLLMKETILRGPENISMEMAVRWQIYLIVLMLNP